MNILYISRIDNIIIQALGFLPGAFANILYVFNMILCMRMFILAHFTLKKQ